MDIVDQTRQKAMQNGVVNIIIAGATCSGKTTLADKLKAELSGEFTVSIIRQDNYFKDIADIPRVRQGYLTDSINAFHTHEFKQDVEVLFSCGKTFIPRYDVSWNKRVAKDVCVTSSQINIFEGLHVISLLGGLENSLTVFLDTPLEVCMERRIARDTKLYGIPEQRIRENFSDCILPMYRSYIVPQKEQAEITTEGSGFL